MTEHQPTSLKEQFLERTFGSDDSQHIKVGINDEVLFEGDLLSARDIRLLRFRRFCWATTVGVCTVRAVQQLLGFNFMQPNQTWYDWAGMIFLLVWGVGSTWLAIRRLRIEAHTRWRLEQQAFFMDDLAEEFAEHMTPAQKEELHEKAIDYLAAADDPTKWDKPWWRLRQPGKSA